MSIYVVTSLLLLCISILIKSQNVENGCWPWNVVLFEMDTAFDEQEKHLIEGQMKYIGQSSCIRFINMLTDVPFKEAPRKYLVVKRADSAYCRTLENNKDGSIVVTIELGRTCTNKRGVLHELVHSLGFKHEHQRVDRKCYVKVFTRKVTQVTAFTVDFNHSDNSWIERFPYNKGSIMHYSRSSKMKARDERLFEWEPLGNAEGSLTVWDIWKINYKHCLIPHYCDLLPTDCEAHEKYEKIMNCKWEV